MRWERGGAKREVRGSPSAVQAKKLMQRCEGSRVTVEDFPRPDQHISGCSRPAPHVIVHRVGSPVKHLRLYVHLRVSFASTA